MKKIYALLEQHEGLYKEYFYLNKEDANKMCKKLNNKSKNPKTMSEAMSYFYVIEIEVK